MNLLTLMLAGVYRASADGSFGYAQDDETRAATETKGVRRARADGSFGYAQDDETGMAEEAAGVHGAFCFSCVFLSTVILSEVEGSNGNSGSMPIASSAKHAPTTDHRPPTTHIANHHPPYGHLLPKEGKRAKATGPTTRVLASSPNPPAPLPEEGGKSDG